MLLFPPRGEHFPETPENVFPATDFLRDLGESLTLCFCIAMGLFS